MNSQQHHLHRFFLMVIVVLFFWVFFILPPLKSMCQWITRLLPRLFLWVTSRGPCNREKAGDEEESKVLLGFILLECRGVFFIIYFRGPKCACQATSATFPPGNSNLPIGQGKKWQCILSHRCICVCNVRFPLIKLWECLGSQYPACHSSSVKGKAKMESWSALEWILALRHPQKVQSQCSAAPHRPEELPKLQKTWFCFIAALHQPSR